MKKYTSYALCHDCKSITPIPSTHLSAVDLPYFESWYHCPPWCPSDHLEMFETKEEAEEALEKERLASFSPSKVEVKSE